MKFFKKDHKFTSEDQTTNALQKKLAGKAVEAIDMRMFDDRFSDAETFYEFNRELLVKEGVYKLFREGLIDFVHQDNCYNHVELVDSVHGKVLTIPIGTALTTKDFLEVYDSIIDSAIATKKKVEKTKE